MSLLLSVAGLVVGSSGSSLRILDGIDLTLHRGEVLGLVGESGCGKSMTCYAIADLLPRGLDRQAGRIAFDGVDLASLPEAGRRAYRGRRIAMIFQDPTSHLNPVHRIGATLEDAICRHQGIRGRAARLEALRLLERVGIKDAASRMNSYPHQFSGGMNQRVMIAHALACRPELLIADEPTTALDVTTQAQILELLDEVRAETGMAMLIVSHDLGVIARLAHRAAVMYCGRIIETAPIGELLERPRHPYTKALIRCMPTVDPDDLELPQPIPGSVPPLSDLPAGCHFNPRCERRVERCPGERPPVTFTGGHMTLCFNPEPVA